MNPVVAKDLLSLLRLRRVAAIQVVFVGVLAALLLLTWPQGGLMTLAAKRQDMLLLSLILGQVVLMVLFVPGIAAVSITSEREQNTLEMLYAARLSAWQIISGKAISALAFPLLLLISALPFVALINYRGAATFDGPALLRSCVVLVLTAAMLAAVSLAVSAWCRQSSTALVIAYLVVLVITGGAIVPAQLMLHRTAGSTAAILQAAQSLSPVAAALSVLWPAFSREALAHGLLTSYTLFVPFSLTIIVACFGALILRLRRPPADAEAMGGAVSDRRSLARKVLVLIDSRKQRRPIGRLNPLLSKERRTSNLRSGRWMIRIFYGSLGLSLALAAMSLMGGVENRDLLENVTQVIVAFQLGLVALVTPSLTTSAISSEIEGGNWDALRLTRLSALSIFWGKLLPALLPALLPVVALLPAYGVVCYVNPGYLPHLLRVLPIVLCAVALCCIIGLVCSSLVANTARATVAAYLVTAALFVLPMFGWWSIGVQFDVQTAKWLCLPSPLVMSLAQLPEWAARRGPVFYLWQGHLALVGTMAAAGLGLAWVRLRYLLRQG